jgi:peptidoglycan/LPS O-acetylase OafA/YrhL
MKSKSFLIAVVILSLTALLGYWAYYEMEGTFYTADFFQLVVIMVLIAFALYLGIRRFASERKGQPAEDELSKRILQKAASSAFYLSLYMWLIISYVSGEVNLENHTIIGTGILCMAILFALSWFYHKTRGIKDA